MLFWKRVLQRLADYHLLINKVQKMPAADKSKAIFESFSFYIASSNKENQKFILFIDISKAYFISPQPTMCLQKYVIVCKIAASYFWNMLKSFEIWVLFLRTWDIPGLPVKIALSSLMCIQMHWITTTTVWLMQECEYFITWKWSEIIIHWHMLRKNWTKWERYFIHAYLKIKLVF